MDMNLFVSDETVALYRRLASASTTECERRDLFDMLAKQYARAADIVKFKILSASVGVEEARGAMPGFHPCEGEPAARLETPATFAPGAFK